LRAFAVAGVSHRRALFFPGTAVGIASFVAPLYLSEIAPQSIRGALISLYQLMITIGIVLAFLGGARRREIGK
jgi:SP family galactose:H+ symporter-like MFS transporter